MQHDPLAQYRRKPPPPGYEPPPNEPDKYSAFDTKDKVFRLRIRGADDSIYAPGYNILLNLLYDKQGSWHFILTYTVMMVLRAREKFAEGSFCQLRKRHGGFHSGI